MLLRRLLYSESMGRLIKHYKLSLGNNMLYVIIISNSNPLLLYCFTLRAQTEMAPLFEAHPSANYSAPHLARV
jgi:hypothetical protein